MTLNVINELLTLLMKHADLQTGDAPVGESDHPYYQSDYWKNYLWKYIHVVAITRSPQTKELTSVLFAPVDAHQRAAWMGKAFPGNKVQLEGTYLLSVAS